jgi:cytochrome P450
MPLCADAPTPARTRLPAVVCMPMRAARCALLSRTGPRLCLGQRLAELEGVFVLTGLLAKFRFQQVAPRARVPYNVSPTMPMKGGLHVLVQPRE